MFMNRLPLLAIAALLVLPACTEVSADPSDPAHRLPPAVADAPRAAAWTDPGPTVDLPPNELGEVMVLEYHRLGEDEGPWVRRPENFRRDLERLYEAGYRPVTVRQLVRGEIDLPAGTTPVAFTFDDSTLGQFYLTEDGEVDPHSMVGMWDAFREEHPAWAGGATWCILPGADHPSNFFGEQPSREVPRAEREARIQRKVDHLVEGGHELCNHTMWHARLDRYDDAFVQDQIGAGQDSILAYAPEGYEITTFSLPFGIWPANRELAWSGRYRDGKRYAYEAVLEVTGGPNPSPFHRDFDGRSVKRVIVAPGALERQMERYDREPGLRFVSDGDPTTVAIPAGAADRVSATRRGERRVVEVGRAEFAP